MYNGIGLETARGTGTNGYVQRNLAFIKSSREKTNYRTEEDIQKSEATLNKPPNPEILEHERLRKVELKCFELRELMTEQNYDDDEIEAKVNEYRRLLTQQMNTETASKATTSELVDDYGRPIAHETHQIAELQREKNDRLKRAFGISDDYVGGAALKRGDEVNGGRQDGVKKQKTVKDSPGNENKERAKPRVKNEDIALQRKEKSSDKSRLGKEKPSSLKDPKSGDKKNKDKKRSSRVSSESSTTSSDDAISGDEISATSTSSDDSDTSTSSSSSSTSPSASSERSTPPRRHKTQKTEKTEKPRHHPEKHGDDRTNKRKEKEVEVRRTTDRDRAGHGSRDKREYRRR